MLNVFMNKLRELHRLTLDLKPTDHRLLYCECPPDVRINALCETSADAGHSAQIKDVSGDEEDELDEGVCNFITQSNDLQYRGLCLQSSYPSIIMAFLQMSTINLSILPQHRWKIRKNLRVSSSTTCVTIRFVSDKDRNHILFLRISGRR